MLHNTVQCTGASCKTLQIPGNLANIFCGLEILTYSNAERPKYCAQMIFYKGGCLNTGVLVHTGAFTQRCFSQRHVFHTNVCTYKCSYPEKLLHKKHYAQVPLHRLAFTQRNFYKQSRRIMRVLLHTDAFTQGCFYAGMLSNMCFYTGVLLTQSIRYTQKLSHMHTHTQILLRRKVYEQKYIHTAAIF